MQNILPIIQRCVTCFALVFGAQAASMGQLLFRDLGAEEVVYDSIRDTLIVSIPDENRIARLNPRSLAEVQSDFDTTGNPNHLSLSASGSVLYVGLDTAPEVIQIDLPTWTQVRRFHLGEAPVGGGVVYANDIAVKPDNDDVIVVALRQFSSIRGIAVYDHGIRLPNVIGNTNEAGSIVFGTSSDTLYGANVDSSEQGFRQYAVDAQGITLVHSVSGLVPSGTDHIVHSNGFIYTDNKWVLHGPSATLVGIYSGDGLTVPAPELNRAFILDFRSDLQSHELDTFTFIEATPRLNPQGSSRSFTRWGTDGFAFTTSQGFIYSFRSSLAWNQLILPPTTLTVLRGNLLQGNAASVLTPDNNRLVLRPGPTFTSLQAPVEIEIQATSPLLSPSSISLSVESQGTSAAVTEKVSFYDYSLSQFVVVNERPTRTQDERVQCDQFDIGHRFVDPATGTVRARIAYKATGPVFGYPWSVGIDLARWVLPK